MATHIQASFYVKLLACFPVALWDVPQRTLCLLCTYTIYTKVYFTPDSPEAQGPNCCPQLSAVLSSTSCIQKKDENKRLKMKTDVAF